MPSYSDLLEAALIGYEAELDRIEQAMAEIRRELRLAAGNAPPAPEGTARAKRKMSAAGRKNLIAALKKRWAKFHREQSKA